MTFSFSQFTFLTLFTLSSLPVCLHAFLLVVIHMDFGQWSDSRNFLYFSVSLVLPQYETVQFLPPPPEVGKPGSSVLMFHEATYQGLIVRFTLLEEVFPSLVCARAKSEFSNHSVSLSTLAHMQIVESTLTRVVKPRAHRHLVPYLQSVQLYRSSATFHTGWCTEVTLICPQLLLLSAPCALSSGPKLSQPSVLLLSGWWPFA